MNNGYEEIANTYVDQLEHRIQGLENEISKLTAHLKCEIDKNNALEIANEELNKVLRYYNKLIKNS